MTKVRIEGTAIPEGLLGREFEVTFDRDDDLAIHDSPELRDAWDEVDPAGRPTYVWGPHASEYARAEKRYVIVEEPATLAPVIGTINSPGGFTVSVRVDNVFQLAQVLDHLQSVGQFDTLDRTTVTSH